MNLLYIDACPREKSRTRILADELVKLLESKDNLTVNKLVLKDEKLPDIDDAAVKKRDGDCAAGNFVDDMYRYARDFAAADKIVIAAPYWDMSFPALLKKYVEAITVNGITFSYSEEGYPVGHCKASNLYYVSTSGGPQFEDRYGFGYIEAMATGMYGIKECHRFAAENMDVYGVDPMAVLKKTAVKMTFEIE